MRFSKGTRGFSLPELGVVLMLAGLLLGLALPTWRHFLEQSCSQNLLEQLSSALRFTRQQALLRHQRLSLCPSWDGRICRGNWQQGFLVFKEAERIGEERQIIRYFQPSQTQGILHWRAFPYHHPDCHFLPSGMTAYENGTFWYCSAGKATPDWALTLSQSGRIREGGVEDLNCRSS